VFVAIGRDVAVATAVAVAVTGDEGRVSAYGFGVTDEVGDGALAFEAGCSSWLSIQLLMTGTKIPVTNIAPAAIKYLTRLSRCSSRVFNAAGE
jgi:hypothetical protein